MADNTTSTEAVVANDPSRYVAEIELYEKEAKTWETASKKIEKRYKDERSERSEKEARYNILWSNVQTLLPALYSRNPKPDFQRRFLDADPVGRVACEILERSTSFTLDKEDFYMTARQCVTDRLLPGRGTVWIRYVPHFAEPETLGTREEVQDEGAQIDDDSAANAGPDVQQHDSAGQPITDVEYEEVDVDYVHWCDFGHNIARTWGEVYIVWRIAYLTREALVKRFGAEKGNRVPLDYTPESTKGTETSEAVKKARIYEMWDRRTKKVVWLSKGMPMELLDERSDMLGLQNFFPCPRPILPNLATDSIIPVPDYKMYQDQAQELDDLTGRISLLTMAIKACGVYDASVPGLQQLLAGGYENKLVPVDSWAALAEKGGLKGSFELLPMADLASTLMSLYEARDKVKNDLYEITGMADIIRGSTDPNETFGAQQIKSNFASIRLEDMQAEVQRFARDVVVMIAEVLANQFDIKTLAEISGYSLMTTAEKQVAQQIVQMGGKLPDDMQKAFLDPAWEEVDELLRNANMRHFRLDIETDSTLKMDQNQEKADRVEFLKAVGQFLEQAASAPPALMPLLAEMLMFAVRAFPVGKSLESAFQETIEKLQQQAKASEGQPKPDPEQIKSQTALQIAQIKQQGDAQADQQRAQLDQQKLALEAQNDKMKAQLDAWVAQQEQQAQAKQAAEEMQMEAQRDALKSHNEILMEQMRQRMDAQTESMKQQFALLIAQLNNSRAIEVAEIAAQSTLDAAQESAARTASSNGAN